MAIWFKNMSLTTIAWVANRDTPIVSCLTLEHVIDVGSYSIRLLTSLRHICNVNGLMKWKMYNNFYKNFTKVFSIFWTTRLKAIITMGGIKPILNTYTTMWQLYNSNNTTNQQVVSTTIYAQMSLLMIQTVKIQNIIENIYNNFVVIAYPIMV